MTISEALRVMRQPGKEAKPFELVLVCGFTPLHLKTFLGAHLQLRLADRSVRVTTGTYGDVPGTLEALARRTAEATGPDAAALVLEWQDLDPRLGFREGGRWSPATLPDVIATVRAALDRISGTMPGLPAGFRLAVSLPGLPFPPLFHAVTGQSTEAEALLDEAITRFAASVAGRPGISLVNARRLAEHSAPATRYDLKSDLLTGLPYTLTHADALAEVMAALVSPAPPKKGIISDLDDTLWHGLIGEVGPEGVSWDLSSHHHLHALYQKLLSALAEEGVFVGIASKNDAAVAEAGLARSDLFVSRDRIFPVEVHWHAKSRSVTNILKTWNISADSVVFVDDNPMELAEVAAEHPGIECVQFPRDDYAAGFVLLGKLRDLFGRERLSAEDALRLDSIRASSELRAAVETGGATESFLEGMNPVVEFDFEASSTDARLLELVNKTNQFNLNGLRYTEADWRRALSEKGAFVAGISYEDKFGPLGKIAVVVGVRERQNVRVTSWVMSCRAFARRIEHQCLQTLFDHCAAGALKFEFAPTPKNGPIQQFFEDIRGLRPTEPFEITREQFESKRPPLYHRKRVLERRS